MSLDTHGGGGGDFAVGIFRRGIFRGSSLCEICHTIFRLLCEINPLRNLAKFLVQQLPEHLETGTVEFVGSVVMCDEGAHMKPHSRTHLQVS